MAALINAEPAAAHVVNSANQGYVGVYEPPFCVSLARVAAGLSCTAPHALRTGGSCKSAVAAARLPSRAPSRTAQDALRCSHRGPSRAPFGSAACSAAEQAALPQWHRYGIAL
eukprot:TRINITY_DN6802_c0_g1_i2.p4 TRINITY_DN6802_c0_g1~~TRINITY_DN6802_c0_g1_i2.p4  ORF type:complete len:113 (-),score=20.82 TRINITY_DN6802_c0_g1_i2:121-459(-)